MKLIFFLYRRLARYCHDERTALLAQLVALFHSFEVRALEEDAGEKAKVEAAQLKVVAMLETHLQVRGVSYNLFIYLS